jgi:hypothetical protein
MSYEKCSYQDIAEAVKSIGEWNYSQISKRLRVDNSSLRKRCILFIEKIKAGENEFLQYEDLLEYPQRSATGNQLVQMSDLGLRDPWAGLDKKSVQDYRKKINKSIREKKTSRFIITSVQNNTELFTPFWDNLLAYAHYIKAAILVVPVRYKNVTAFIKNSELYDDIWYPEEVRDYLVSERIRLHKDLILMSDVRVAATASDPLSGLDNLSKQSSAIYAHPQVRLKPIPTPQFRLPIVLSTTGSLSKLNYSQTKAGEVGKHHHSISAVIIEMDKGCYHHRHIHSCNDGSFIDLTHEMIDGKRKVAPRAAALVTGDEHAIFFDPGVKKATYTNKDSIANILKPEYLVRHDVLDFHSGSHHHRKDEFVKFKKWVNQLNNIEEELEATCKHIDATTPKWAKNLIVDSNHNRHFTRWLIENDIKVDQENAIIYYYMKWRMLSEINDNPESIPDPFQLYCEEYLETFDRSVFADPDKGFIINDIDHAQHGDLGANGARGNMRSFARSSYKMIVGHAHSPEIMGGTYRTGKSSVKHDYEKGLSNNMHTHCIHYANGKRTLINVIDGKWRK